MALLQTKMNAISLQARLAPARTPPLHRVRGSAGHAKLPLCAPTRSAHSRRTAAVPPALDGLAAYLQSQADTFSQYDLPEWLIKWGHGGNMAVVLFAMGGYGAAYLGWQIRTSNDAQVLQKAKDLHPKLSLGMYIFFALGGLGGTTSLLMQEKPIWESSHVTTALIGLSLLTVQALLPALFNSENGGEFRTAHAILGSSVMAVFLVHAGLGLQLGLSL